MIQRYHLLVWLLFSAIWSSTKAQTNPAAQALPFRFTAQTGATLPAGVAVHRFGTSAAAIPTTRTTLPGNADLLYVTAANSGGWRAENDNGLSLLASGSQSAGALVVSLNTAGKANIQVSWTVRAINQQASRDNSIALQYRIGSSSPFINIGTGSTFSSSGKTPGESATFSELLPAEANNRNEVQVRWIYWESFSTGGGSRDRLSVDDISIDGSGGDFSAPVVQDLNPDNGQTGIVPNQRPSIVFSEGVEARAGRRIFLHDQTRNTTQTFDLAGESVQVTGNTLTLNTVLKPFRSYAIEIEPGAVADASGNEFAGLTGADKWAFTTGEQQLVFDFNDCSGVLPGGFTRYSFSGSQQWECTTFGQEKNGLQISGFSGSARTNEDWLISPAFDLSYFAYPLLSFSSRTRFAGPGLRLMVSTDYNGTGNPGSFTWTEVNGRFPEMDSDVWTESRDINLSAYKGETVYVAFVYRSSETDGAARWTLDNFRMVRSETAPVPDILVKNGELDFDYTPSGTQSAVQSLVLLPYNLQSDLQLTAPAGFELSADGTRFGSSITLSQSKVESIRTEVFLRFAPAAANTEYSAALTASATGLNRTAALLSGSSLRALKVVNWNVEWFGSSEEGPANDAQQQANVQAILQKTNADIYALSEIVDTARLKALVDGLPGYAYSVSEFGSYADNVNDPDYASAQKLVFVYRTSVVQQLEARGVLRFGASPEASYHWSSGRFPYLMQAEVSLEGVTTTVNLVLLHGKANTGSNADKQEAWERRKLGADELKDTLDAYYNFSNVVILGDFNDDLDETIAPNIPGNTSSYSSYLNDAARYKPLTLPLSLAGQRSTVSNTNVIDHQLVSNEMGVAYVPNSAKILTSVAGWVVNYGNSTSDHYPVVARYDLRFFASPIALNGFAGAVEGNRVRFTWTTDHEINSRYFVIERSRNGKDFEAVDSLAGQGDKRTATEYSHGMAKPWPGQSHYRIRIVSLDGTVTYSSAITVNMRSNSHLLNAHSDASRVTVRYTSEEALRGTLQLADMSGRLYFSETVSFVKGSNTRFIPARKLPAGIYVIRLVHADGTMETGKIYIGR